MHLPDLSIDEAERRSRVGRALLERVCTVNMDALPHDLALTLRLVRSNAQTWANSAAWYWTVIDPLGAGVFGMFAPTAYCGGTLLSFVNRQLRDFQFVEAGDCDRYLGLIADYARLLNQISVRTVGQAGRGMRMPRLQVERARALIQGFKSSAPTTVSVAPERLTNAPSAGFAREIERRIATHIVPEFDRILAIFSDEYLSAAPQSVGLSQYAGGEDIYAALVKLYTTLDVTPEQVHERGLIRMAEIGTAMESVRQEAGFPEDSSAFIAHLSRDPRWRANTVEGVIAVFQRYIDRMRPIFGEHFHDTPTATCSVVPLPEALQGSMTFGYYDPPTANRNHGSYFFNAGNLVKQPLYSIAALTYHELIPGHHLHLGTQLKDEALHPLRRHSMVTAYNEGWAEYASTFAGEIGMYERPEERYGRLLWDGFFTCRLIVDTGMNSLGWSIEKARDFMREFTGMSDAEITTESVRYSCDIPAQSLAYKVGDAQIMKFREKMRRTLGKRFSVRDFHAAVLRAGSIPLGDLEWHLDYETEVLAMHPVT